MIAIRPRTPRPRVARHLTDVPRGVDAWNQEPDVRGSSRPPGVRRLGMAVGTVTVPEGIALELNGTPTRDLLVDSGGRARIRGTVVGVVVNRGGDVVIYGTVGAVRDLAGTTSSMPKRCATTAPRAS